MPKESLEEMLKKLGELGRGGDTKENLEKIDSLLEFILETVQGMSKDKQPKAYSNVTDVLIDIDMKDKAKGTLENTLESTSDLDDPYQKALSYTSAAEIQLRLDMKDEAKGTIDLAAGSAEDIFKISDIVEAKGDWTRIDNNLCNKAIVLAYIGEVRTRVEESDKIKKFFEPALDAVKIMIDPAKKAEAYRKIAKKQIEVSKRMSGLTGTNWTNAAIKTLDLALSETEKISSPYTKKIACQELAELYVGVGKLEKTSKIIEIIPHHSKSWICAYLAPQYGFKSAFTKAAELIKSVEDKYLLAWSNVRLAEVKLDKEMEANEEIKSAEDAAKDIRDAYLQTEIYKDLANLYRRTKDDVKVLSSSKLSKESAEKITDKANQSKRYIEIELADPSHKPNFELAKNSAKTENDPYQKASIYLHVASVERRYDVSSAKKTLELAFDAAKDITDEEEKLEVLLEITKEKKYIDDLIPKPDPIEDLASLGNMFFGE